jgi:FkbM family methyltransferase
MSGLLKPLWAGPARHLLRLARDADFRELAWLESRLGRRPRFTPLRVRAHGWSLEVPDAASFLASWKEIVVDGRYAFRWPGPAPRILDLGANVGLSVLHFKALHPGAEILAVEADPTLFGCLERNLEANAVHGVERMQRAAWTGPGRVRFKSDGADAGRVVLGDDVADAAGLLEIETLDVPALLAARTFDFIKMDIEGAEVQVLPACGAALGRARFVAVEYHAVTGAPQHLGAVFQTLEGCGFRVHVESVSPTLRPFFGVHRDAGFELQLNLFGWKP